MQRRNNIFNLIKGNVREILTRKGYSTRIIIDNWYQYVVKVLYDIKDDDLDNNIQYDEENYLLLIPSSNDNIISISFLNPKYINLNRNSDNLNGASDDIDNISSNSNNILDTNSFSEMLIDLINENKKLKENAEKYLQHFEFQKKLLNSLKTQNNELTVKNEDLTVENKKLLTDMNGLDADVEYLSGELNKLDSIRKVYDQSNMSSNSESNGLLEIYKVQTLSEVCDNNDDLKIHYEATILEDADTQKQSSSSTPGTSVDEKNSTSTLRDNRRELRRVSKLDSEEQSINFDESIISKNSNSANQSLEEKVDNSDNRSSVINTYHNKQVRYKNSVNEGSDLNDNSSENSVHQKNDRDGQHVKNQKPLPDMLNPKNIQSLQFSYKNNDQLADAVVSDSDEAQLEYLIKETESRKTRSRKRRESN